MQSAIIRGGTWARGRLMQLISQTATQEGASDPRVAVFGLRSVTRRRDPSTRTRQARPRRPAI